MTDYRVVGTLGRDLGVHTEWLNTLGEAKGAEIVLRSTHGWYDTEIESREDQ